MLQKHSVFRRVLLTLLVIANHKVSWLCERGIDWCCRNQNGHVGYRNCSSNIGSSDKLHSQRKGKLNLNNDLLLCSYAERIRMALDITISVFYGRMRS